MAMQILHFLENFPMNPKVESFINNKNHQSDIDKLINEVAQWDQSGDTNNLPENLRPNILPEEIYALMKPLQSATNSAFEVGYKRGYDSKNRKDTIYADCMIEIKAKAGEKITVEVTADEIISLFPEINPNKLEGLDVIFDNPPENYLASKGTETTVKMSNGKALFEFYTTTPTPILMGIRVQKSAKTKNKSLELCRRMIIFEN